MKKCNHNYCGGVCINCFEKQPVYNNGKEQGFEKVKPRVIKKKNITSEFQLFVDDTMSYLKEDVYKKNNFSKYAGVIKKFGMFQVRIWIKSMKEKGISSPKYFWGIIRNNKL